MPSEWENNSSSSSTKVSSSSTSSLSASSSTATSPEPNTNGNNNNNNDSAKNGHEKDCALKASTMSHDPTPYVARARVTRPTPPKPSCNPMQFVQIKPCNLYQSAQQQLKKAEEIKKVKEVMKEEPEDWQNNLDNWKSSRRKRVEHIIERVVEVKKLEEEEHDRTRRKSKTFSEMMEERGERGRGRTKLQSLASYNEDEANDLSDLGIGTSSASGKSSISEDCEVHSIVSEPAEVETISSFDIENNSCQPCHDNDNRDRISSPGYETSSTAPVASPDPYEYTYEGAIEDYKSRVSKATASSIYKKPAASIGENSITRSQVSDKKPTDNDDDDTELRAAAVKMEDLPKIDISKKRELFEKPEANKKLVPPTAIQNHDQIEKKRIPSEFANVRSIKDRLCSLEKKPESIVDESTTGILSAEAATPSIKERLQCLEQQNSVNPKPNINKVVAEVVAVPPLKDRLSSLQNAVTKEEVVKKPIVLVDEYQLEMLKNEDLARRQLELDTSKDDVVEKAPSDDSGINTTDEKIDHDPATTEDEDDEEHETNIDEKNQMHDEKVPPSASANDFQGEFDSSVSLLQLKSLNTPTVVSLVDKPIVIDVDGVGDKSKLVRSNDEVNHAQNLLKMFKLAFDEDDDVVVEETKLVDSKMNQKFQDSQASVKDTTVPWRKAPPKVNNAVIQASKIPQVVSKVEFSPAKTDQVEIEIHSGKEITDIVKKSIIEASKTGGNLKIGNNIVENAKKSLAIASKTPVFEKVNSVEDILKDDLCKTPTKSFQNFDNKSSKNSQNISEKFRKISESEIPTQKVDGESQNASKTVRCNNRYGAKPHDLVSNLINDPESTKSIQNINTVKSQIPTPKVNVEAKVSNTVSPNKGAKPNNLVSTQNNKENSPKSPTTETQNILKMSPINSRYGAKPHDLVSNLILNIDNSNKKSMIPVPSTSAMESPTKTPIYENVAPVGLKKASTPLNNGRVEIFNSNSMPTKPKSPEVLPRGIKPFPKEETIKPGVQTKDFQKSAFNEFLDSLVIDDIEAWQPKIVAEQPKQSSEAIAVENVPQCASEHVESPSTEKTVDSKTIESPSNEKTETPSNVPIKQCSPLPIESCVDILQSFLNAERSHAVPLICDPIEKKSSQINSDSFIRQETVVEIPCSKVDVKDLPDPNFICTPCIDVICGGQSPQTQQRESVSSSAGDSSPSSDITVIFKSNASPAPGSPTPNRSTLMQIANRVSSPVAGRRNPPTVVEQPCLKLDVKDLPDPNFIRTPCVDVEKKALSQCNTSASGASSPSTPSSWLHKTNVDVLKLTCNDIPNTPPLSPVLGRPSSPSTPTSWLHKTNADVLKQTCDDITNTPPLSPVLGRHGSPTSEKPNFLIARVEVVETKIKVTTTNDDEAPPAVPSSPPPPMTVESPKPSRKSALTSKPKNIFEFLKRNFQSKPDVALSTAPEGEFKPISVDNSKFYVPSDVISSSTTVDATPEKENPPNNGVNIEIIKTITTDSIVEQSDSQLNLTDEINDILDEEISKLVVEDANL